MPKKLLQLLKRSESWIVSREIRLWMGRHLWIGRCLLLSKKLLQMLKLVSTSQSW